MSQDPVEQSDRMLREMEHLMETRSKAHKKLEVAEGTFLYECGWEYRTTGKWVPGPEARKTIHNPDKYAGGVDIGHAINIQKGADSAWRRKHGRWYE